MCHQFWVKKYYSGKKKRHTVKTQITANQQGLIFDVFGGIEGKRHDFQVFQDSGVAKDIPKLVNKLINRSRVIGEHVLSRLKKFRIIKEIFRNRLNKYYGIFNRIAGIVNLRTLNRSGLEWS